MPETATINRNDLRAYPGPVQKVLVEAINTHGVPYRMLDGTHIRLYSGNRDETPFKVAASRDAKYTLAYLLPWLEERFPSWAEREQVSAEDLENLAAVLSTSEHADSPSDEGTNGASEGEQDDATSWKSFKYGFDTDGETYRCTYKGCQYTQSSPRGLHLHEYTHTGKREQVMQKAVESRQVRGEQRKIMLQQAVAVLAEAHGVNGDKALQRRLAKAEKDNERLIEKVATLEAQNADLKAKLALIQEAMRA